MKHTAVMTKAAVVACLVGFTMVGQMARAEAGSGTKAAGSGSKKVEAKSHQTVCPIEGTKINRKDYTDYHGKRIYFCCAACKAKFNAAPDTYMKKLAEQGIILENAPKSKSPATGSGTKHEGSGTK